MTRKNKLLNGDHKGFDETISLQSETRVNAKHRGWEKKRLASSSAALLCEKEVIGDRSQPEKRGRRAWNRCKKV